MRSFARLTLFGLLLAPSLASAAWWNPAWQVRHTVTVQNPSGQALTDLPVRVLLGAGFSFAQSAADGADLRAVGADGTSALPLWLEAWNKAAGAGEVWVRVPSLPANGSATFSLYTGNPAASSASTRRGRWEVYDDFNGAALDNATWVPIVPASGSTAPTVSGGRLNLSVSVNHDGVGITSKQAFRSDGATLKAELIGFERTGDTFNYASPAFELVSPSPVSGGPDSHFTYVSHGGYGWSVYPYEFLSWGKDGVESSGIQLGAAHASGDVTLLYQPSYGSVAINGAVLGEATSGLPAPDRDMFVRVVIAKPYDGYMGVSVDKVIVSKLAPAAPAVSVGTAQSQNAPPVATILAPSNGAVVAFGTPLVLSGAGVDPEDGALPGTSLRWSSDVDGPLGAGSTVTASKLSAGLHTLTLTATDSGGATGSAMTWIVVSAELSICSAKLAVCTDGLGKASRDLAEILRVLRLSEGKRKKEPNNGQTTDGKAILQLLLKGEQGEGRDRD